eukprot:m.134111 g.134111  ORF g.134111 m.134111 type:complete len:1003 (+) comp38130_c0_seq15:511-3519(+)
MQYRISQAIRNVLVFILQQFEMGARWLNIFPPESFAISYIFTAAFKKAKISRKAKACHRSCYIVGNQRGGKTSLLKSLAGEPFCKEEKATEGAKIHNARPGCELKWKLEENPVSNFLRQAMAEAIAVVNSGGICQVLFSVILYFFVLVGTVIVNYQFKNMLQTISFLLVLSFTLLWKNHDMIGRLVISVWAFLFIFDDQFVLLQFHGFNLLGILFAAFGIGCFLGLLLFTNVASGFIISLSAYGIGPGSILNSDCFTIEQSSYLTAAVGIIIGFAFGIPFGLLATYTRDVSIRRGPPFFLLFAFTVCLFPMLFFVVLKASWLQLGHIYPEQFENKSIVQAVMDNPANSLHINVELFLLWIAVGSLILAGIMLVAGPARKLLLLPFPEEDGTTKPCLLGKVRLQSTCFCIGVLLGLFTIVGLNFFDIVDTCPSIFGMNCCSILTASLAFALQASYWPERVRNTLNFNCASINPDGTANYIVLGDISKFIAKDKQGFEELQQPLIKITDFGGEEFYRTLHPVFRRPKGVCLIVFSFKAFDEKEPEAYNVDEKQDLITCIKRTYEYSGRESKAFLVGTHRDSYKNAPEWRKKIVAKLYEAVSDCDSLRRELVYMEDDNPFSMVFQIENDGPRDDPDLVCLRNKIESQFSICDEKFEEVENAVYQLEDEVTEMNANPDSPPIITRQQLEVVARKKCGLTDHRLTTAIKYLENFQVIITSYQLPAREDNCEENDQQVLIKPQLLASVVAQLSKQAVRNDCIFSKKEITKIICKHFSSFDPDNTLKFLRFHGFLASLSNHRWALVACLPPGEEPSWDKENDSPCFYVQFRDAECIHQQIFSRLLTRILESSDDEVESFDIKLRKESGTFAFCPGTGFSAITYRIECHPVQEIFKVSIISGNAKEPHRLMSFLFRLLLALKKSHFPLVDFIAGSHCSRDKCLERAESKTYSPLVGHILPFRKAQSDLENYCGKHLPLFCGVEKLDHDSLRESDSAWLTPLQKRPPVRDV